MASDQNGVFQTEAAAIQYLDGLFSYALMLTRNRTEAEDLVQETYVRAIQAIDRLRENSNLKSWLFTILRNIWLNQLRKRKSTPQLVNMDGDGNTADGLLGHTRDSYDILVSNEDTERVRSAIQSLPIDFREIILLREFEELSYHEIATVLGCPAGTVMSRLGRARARLRTLLANTAGPTRATRKKKTS
jgi:RNA polymerase sigma-70 factor (ECF subfamily)